MVDGKCVTAVAIQVMRFFESAEPPIAFHNSFLYTLILCCAMLLLLLLLLLPQYNKLNAESDR
jgi:hypothetical protein